MFSPTHLPRGMVREVVVRVVVVLMVVVVKVVVVVTVVMVLVITHYSDPTTIHKRGASSGDGSGGHHSRLSGESTHITITITTTITIRDTQHDVGGGGSMGCLDRDRCVCACVCVCVCVCVVCDVVWYVMWCGGCASLYVRVCVRGM